MYKTAHLKWGTLACLIGTTCLTFSCSLDLTLGELGVVGTSVARPGDEGTIVELSATSRGGTPPYVFRWSQEDAPFGAVNALTEFLAPMVTTVELVTPGEYTFRVLITDSVGDTSEDFVRVEVFGVGELGVVAASDTRPGDVGTIVELSSTPSGGTPPYTFRWSQAAAPSGAGNALTETQGRMVTTDEVLTPGEYTFEVVITDDVGDTSVGSVLVEVFGIGELGVAAASVTRPGDVGTIVELSATPTGGTPPYNFSWSQEEAPSGAANALTEFLARMVTTDELLTSGEYTFRVLVTDSVGDTSEDFVRVEIVAVPEEVFTIAAEGAGLVVVGEAADLSVTIDPPEADVTLAWEVVQGSGTLDDPASATPTLTTDAGETLIVRVTVTAAGGDAPRVQTADLEVVSVQNLMPRVIFSTTAGDFTLELDGELAPLTTANLLAYVDDGFFDGVLIHRIASTSEGDPFVIQGGGFVRVDDEIEAKDVTRDPVLSEAGNGLSNGTLYSVSMALSGGNANSGTTQFFINLNEENAFLDDQDFTVFGFVVEGVDVVDAMALLEVVESPLSGLGVSLPAVDLVINSATRAPGN